MAGAAKSCFPFCEGLCHMQWEIRGNSKSSHGLGESAGMILYNVTIKKEDSWQ